MNDYIYYIKENISQASLLEQLAEECSELSQAALKKARKIRNENYTPKTMSEINACLLEETMDVLVCMDILNLPRSNYIKDQKIKRWAYRNGYNDE